MKDDSVCDVFCYDENTVKAATDELETIDISTMSSMFKAMSNETRLKIIFSLYKNEKLCVCDIANIINSSVQTASHHLRLLHKNHIVKYKKEGKMSFYSLDDTHIKDIFSLAISHNHEER